MPWIATPPTLTLSGSAYSNLAALLLIAVATCGYLLWSKCLKPVYIGRLEQRASDTSAELLSQEASSVSSATCSNSSNMTSYASALTANTSDPFPRKKRATPLQRPATPQNKVNPANGVTPKRSIGVQVGPELVSTITQTSPVYQTSSYFTNLQSSPSYLSIASRGSSPPDPASTTSSSQGQTCHEPVPRVLPISIGSNTSDLARRRQHTRSNSSAGVANTKTYTSDTAPAGPSLRMTCSKSQTETHTSPRWLNVPLSTSSEPLANTPSSKATSPLIPGSSGSGASKKKASTPTKWVPGLPRPAEPSTELDTPPPRPRLQSQPSQSQMQAQAQSRTQTPADATRETDDYWSRNPLTQLSHSYQNNNALSDQGNVQTTRGRDTQETTLTPRKHASSVSSESRSAHRGTATTPSLSQTPSDVSSASHYFPTSSPRSHPNLSSASQPQYASYPYQQNPSLMSQYQHSPAPRSASASAPMSFGNRLARTETLMQFHHQPDYVSSPTASPQGNPQLQRKQSLQQQQLGLVSQHQQQMAALQFLQAQQQLYQSLANASASASTGMGMISSAASAASGHGQNNYTSQLVIPGSNTGMFEQTQPPSKSPSRAASVSSVTSNLLPPHASAPAVAVSGPSPSPSSAPGSSFSGQQQQQQLQQHYVTAAVAASTMEQLQAAWSEKFQKLEARMKEMQVSNERKSKELEIASWRLQCVEVERAAERTAEEKQRSELIAYFVKKYDAAEQKRKAEDHSGGSFSSPPSEDVLEDMQRCRSSSLSVSDASLISDHASDSPEEKSSPTLSKLDLTSLTSAASMTSPLTPPSYTPSYSNYNSPTFHASLPQPPQRSLSMNGRNNRKNRNKNNRYPSSPSSLSSPVPAYAFHGYGPNYGYMSNYNGHGHGQRQQYYSGNRPGYKTTSQIHRKDRRAAAAKLSKAEAQAVDSGDDDDLIIVLEPEESEGAPNSASVGTMSPTTPATVTSPSLPPGLEGESEDVDVDVKQTTVAQESKPALLTDGVGLGFDTCPP